MSETGIYFTDESGRQDAIIFDVLFREDPSDEVETTDHPVEEGAPVSDHARNLPVVLRLEALISETPMTDEQFQRAGLDPPQPVVAATLTLAAQVGAPLSAQADLLNSRDARQYVPGFSTAMYEKIRALKQRRVLVTIKTPRRTYENMIVTSVSAPKDPATGEALRVNISAKEMRLVRTQTRIVEQTVKRTKAVAKLGRKPTKAELDAERKARLGLKPNENLILKSIGMSN